MEHLRRLLSSPAEREELETTASCHSQRHREAAARECNFIEKISSGSRPDLLAVAPQSVALPMKFSRRGLGRARRSLALPRPRRENFFSKATLCGATAKQIRAAGLKKFFRCIPLFAQPLLDAVE